MNCVLKIKAVPNSQKFQVCEFNSWDESLRIKLQSQAIKGKANEELIERLSEMLGSEVRIVQGKTSRNKLMEIKGKSKEEVLKILKP